MQVTYSKELFVQHFTELYPYRFTRVALKAIFDYYENVEPDFEFVADTILVSWKEYIYATELNLLALRWERGHAFTRKLSNGNALVFEPFALGLAQVKKTARDVENRIKDVEAELAKLRADKVTADEAINLLTPLVKLGKEKQK